MIFDPFYMLVFGVGTVLSMLAQWRVKGAFDKWSNVRTTGNLTGAEIARRILQVNGIRDVRVEQTNGYLSDHYDPTSKTLRLSPDVYSQPSVAAVGVAAHEVGHAIQHAQGYRWLQMRSALVPPLQITSNMAMPVMMLGFVLVSFGMAAIGTLALQIGVLLFSVMLVFQLVTLPVEFDASNRALAAIQQGGLVDQREFAGAKEVLNAAALTYVAAAVATALQVLYFAWRAGLLGGNDD
jgi:Zn-dependent membrane protease YugP